MLECWGSSEYLAKCIGSVTWWWLCQMCGLFSPATGEFRADWSMSRWEPKASSEASPAAAPVPRSLPSHASSTLGITIAKQFQIHSTK